MKCPRCKTENSFSQQIYEGTEIDKCNTCNGVWLDEGELIKIVQTKEETFDDQIISDTITLAFKGVPQEEARSIENCPKCGKALKAINYSYSSGIIIDRCPDSHGVWLDHQELEKVQAFKEHWDKEAEQHRDDWLALARSVNENNSEQDHQDRMKEMRPTKYLVNSMLRKLFGL